MNKIVKISLFSVLGLIVLAGVFMSTSGIYPLSMGLHDATYQEHGFALSGYDAVAYHLDGTASKGNSEFSTMWNNVKWQFNSQAHLDSFKVKPTAYAPQNGGYCSFAVSKGFTAPGNPESWYIEGGKLYILHDADVKKEFLADKENILKAVKENWK